MPAEPGGERSLPEISDRELERLYDYPDTAGRPWVQANFVSSMDGAVAVSGRSEGLSGPTDKRIFALGRDLADVVLVGAGTALVERYRPVRRSTARVERRERLGLRGIPPVAVVTRRCSLTPDSALLTDATVAPIILTCRGAPEQRKAALAEAGAEVLELGDESVDLPRALDALAARGLRRICCEGGPHLFGQLIADDLVDQLCLTIAPLLAGGDAGRIAVGPLPASPHAMRLASVLHDDGFLMLRYRRQRR
ncbi:MAG: pyrimidine reductase family protein [Pseudonocardiaceae bacterium]|nr:pyrimidine reductase family protein [Pseudonocardiaceae bacterium]